MNDTNLRAELLAWADVLNRRTGTVPAVDVAWKLRQLASPTTDPAQRLTLAEWHSVWHVTAELGFDCTGNTNCPARLHAHGCVLDPCMKSTTDPAPALPLCRTIPQGNECPGRPGVECAGCSTTTVADPAAATGDGPADELDDYLRNALRSPEFREGYEDATSRHGVLDALVARRNDLGLTQTAVAKSMSVRQPTVSQFEREDSDPKLSTVQRYARAVGARLVVHVEPAAPQAPAEPTGNCPRCHCAEPIHKTWCEGTVETTATPEDWRQAYELKLADFARETGRTSAMLAAVREVPANLSGEARNAFLLAQARVRAAAGSAETPTEQPVCTGFLDCPAAEHSPKCNAARAAREDAATPPLPLHEQADLLTWRVVHVPPGTTDREDTDTPITPGWWLVGHGDDPDHPDVQVHLGDRLPTSSAATPGDEYNDDPGGWVRPTPIQPEEA